MSRAAIILLLVSLTYIRPAIVHGQAGSQSVLVRTPGVSVIIDQGNLSISIPGGFSFAPPGEPALPWLCVFFNGKDSLSASKIQLVALETDTLMLPLRIAPATREIETRADSPILPETSAAADYAAPFYPAENSRIEQGAVWQGHEVNTLYWCPFRYYPKENRLEIIRRGVLLISRKNEFASRIPRGGETSAITGFSDVRQLCQSMVTTPAFARMAGIEAGRSITVGTPTDVEYVIITNDQLLPALRPLAEWRQMQGYRVGIALVTDIEQAYSGEDTPGKIRSYLADAHAGGLQLCVLGGDETVVPIRYAYHAYSDTMPSYDRLQVCDLYYADLNGDWDTDGDGIYGEYLQDHADLFPEMYVGRLLAANVPQAEAIAAKIIAYETDPGNGDAAYLTRALFTCADQMRDWNGGEGQHAIVSANFPSHFTLDLSSQAENPLGSLPDPVLPEGVQFVEQAATGWGWTVILNHGRADGFVLRAAGINQWPKSYVWSYGSNGDGHGHLNLLSDNSPPGIFLSVACEIGGFDLDGPLFGGFYGPNVAELLLRQPKSGAAAVIAYSRWGWVASSYRIAGKFIEYAFDSTLPPQIGAAFALAKANFPYYRDQSYGLNLYGDPAMPLWTTQPKTMTADFPALVPAGSGAVTFTAAHNGGPLSGALITAVYADTVLFSGETDEYGAATWTNGPDRLGGYDITVTKPGFLPVRSRLIVPITSGIDEEESQVFPFALEQNYPNPFNPTTVVAFSTATTDHVRVDVYDILGRRVNTLADGIMSSGRHELEFTGDDAEGSPLPSGVYFYRLQAGSQTKIKKMVLLR